jgi:hypothetical protein
MEERSSSAAGGRGIWPVQSLNYFMADMQAGIGPFRGVFLMRRPLLHDHSAFTEFQGGRGVAGGYGHRRRCDRPRRQCNHARLSAAGFVRWNGHNQAFNHADPADFVAITSVVVHGVMILA